MSATKHYPLDPDEARRLAELEATSQPHGPYAPAIVLGLLGLVVAAGVLAQELHLMQVDLAVWGPWIVVALGVVLLLVGAVGIGRRAR